MPKFTRQGKFRRALKRKPATRSSVVKRMRMSAPKATFRRKQAVLGKFFPDKAVMTHKYVETFTLTTTGGVINTYQFKCNGMFDPNTTGTGHQPMGYDQMAALYDHWCVIGSRIRLKIAQSTSGEDIVRVALYKDDDVTALADMDTIAEQTPSQVKTIAPNSNDVTILKSNWSLKKTFGGGALIGNERYQGSAASDCAELTMYTLALGGITAVNSTVCITAEIEYIAVWTELKSVAGS